MDNVSFEERKKIEKAIELKSLRYMISLRLLSVKPKPNVHINEVDMMLYVWR